MNNKLFLSRSKKKISFYENFHQNQEIQDQSSRTYIRKYLPLFQ